LLLLANFELRHSSIMINQPQTQSELTNQLTTIADQLRSLSNNGLHFSQDPYQTERYHKILGLAAQLVSLVDERPSTEIEQHFFTDLNMLTPLSVVDTAVFDDEGRILLIQRADNQTWAMPGGACDVGETPAEGGVREVWEETGYHVQITNFLGVFDSRICGSRGSRQLYHFLFAAKPINSMVDIRNGCAIHWLGALIQRRCPIGIVNCASATSVYSFLMGL